MRGIVVGLGIAGAAVATAGCTSAETSEDANAAATEAAEVAPPAGLDSLAADIVARPNISGFGLAKIDDGEVAWTRYYGEQSDGVPISETTMFNTASVAKTILAETT
ncbi:MAG: serine hydrolase, partial [Pseudomonadota bacterium]